MTEDKFWDRLRSDSAQLRYTPHDDVVWTRLAARVRDRMHSEASVAQMLARWFRPIMASFAMLALVAALSVTWIERHEAASSVETIASNSVEITLDGDTYSLAE